MREKNLVGVQNRKAIKLQVVRRSMRGFAKDSKLKSKWNKNAFQQSMKMQSIDVSLV